MKKYFFCHSIFPSNYILLSKPESFYVFLLTFKKFSQFISLQTFTVKLKSPVPRWFNGFPLQHFLLGGSVATSSIWHISSCNNQPKAVPYLCNSASHYFRIFVHILSSHVLFWSGKFKWYGYSVIFADDKFVVGIQNNYVW
jgi:hypothetical protein